MTRGRNIECVTINPVIITFVIITFREVHRYFPRRSREKLPVNSPNIVIVVIVVAVAS